MSRPCLSFLLLAVALLPGLAHADALPVSALHEGTRVIQASISPDARHLALVLRAGGRNFVAVRDRTKNVVARPVLAHERANSLEADWCRFANNTRIVCGYSGTTEPSGGGPYLRGLTSVNVDGTNPVEFYGSGRIGAEQRVFINPTVVDWTLDDPAHLLISTFEFPFLNLDGPGTRRPRTMLRIDVATGRTTPTIASPDGTTRIVGDGRGSAFLATGFMDGVFHRGHLAYGRAPASTEWKKLTRLAAHERDAFFLPVGVLPGSRDALMLLDHEGRVALWKVDLADERDPEPHFWHTEFNVRNVLLGADNRLLGARLSTTAIGASYMDPDAIRINESLRRRWPDRWHDIVSTTPDMKAVVVRSWGAAVVPSFHIVLIRDGEMKIEPIGSAVPGFEKRLMPKTENVVIPREPSRHLFAELTMPAARTSSGAPLVVLVDDWNTGPLEFDALAKIVASNGYAVLRTQPVQSSRDNRWDLAPYADWSGEIYDDVMAATRWARERPGIDGAATCIVGMGYGGYVAMHAAVRADSDLECAVSVNGFSDLEEARRDSQWGMGKLAPGIAPPAVPRLVSVRGLARDAHARVLLVHHADNRPSIAQADPSHAKGMAGALRRAGKPHRVALLDEPSDAFEARWYTELLGFLAERDR